MRRPLIWYAAVFVLGIAAGYYLYKLYIAAVIAVIVVISIIILPELRRPIMASAAVFVLAFFIMGMGEASFDKVEKLAGEQISLTGIVSEIEQRDGGGFNMVVSYLQVPGYDKEESIKKMPGKVKVSSYRDSGEDIRPGQYVSISGCAELPKGQRNPACFNYRRHLASLKIRIMVTADQVQIIDTGQRCRASAAERIYVGLMLFSCNIKEKYIRILGRNVPDEKVAVIRAMLFGETEYMDEDLFDSFRKNGTSHIMAVSGLHLMIVYSLLVGIVERLNVRRRISVDLVVTVMLIFYCAMAGFSPSVMRAVTMVLLNMFSVHLYCRYDLTCSACAAVMVLLFTNPWYIFNAGFRLSFLAIFSLAVLLPFFAGFAEGRVLPLMVIQAGLTPYTMYTFNYVSLGGLVANIPVGLVAGLIIPCGIVNAGTSYFFVQVLNVSEASLLCRIFIDLPAQITGFLTDVLMQINGFTFAGGKLTFDVPGYPVFFLVLYYVLIFVFCSEFGQLICLRRDRKLIAMSLILALFLAAAGQVIMYNSFSQCKMVFVDVGQGDCLHIRGDDGYNILIDGGGSDNYDVGVRTLKPYLLKNGVARVDLAIVTHLHTDHYKGIRELAAAGMIDKLCLYEGYRSREKEVLRECRMKPGSIVYARAGDSIKVAGVEISVLFPESVAGAGSGSDEEDENANSLVLKCSQAGVSVIMTGDIDEKGEENVLKSAAARNLDMRADILKISHHGSRYSSGERFLKSTGAGAAVVQVGKNNYGHPADITLSKCKKLGMKIYRNDQLGAIGIKPNSDGKIEVKRVTEPQESGLPVRKLNN